MWSKKGRKRAANLFWMPLCKTSSDIAFSLRWRWIVTRHYKSDYNNIKHASRENFSICEINLKKKIKKYRATNDRNNYEFLIDQSLSTSSLWQNFFLIEKLTNNNHCFNTIREKFRGINIMNSYPLYTLQTNEFRKKFTARYIVTSYSLINNIIMKFLFQKKI